MSGSTVINISIPSAIMLKYIFKIVQLLGHIYFEDIRVGMYLRDDERKLLLFVKGVEYFDEVLDVHPEFMRITFYDLETGSILKFGTLPHATLMLSVFYRKIKPTTEQQSTVFQKLLSDE